MKVFAIVALIMLVIIAGLGVALKTRNNKLNQEMAQIEKSSDKVEESSSGSCIISLFGKEYNVQLLRKIHPGGDIFKCGEDMTETFKNQHGEDLKRVEEYLIKSS